VKMCIHAKRAEKLFKAIQDYRSSSITSDLDKSLDKYVDQQRRDAILWRAIIEDDKMFSQSSEDFLGCEPEPDKAVEPDHYIGNGGLRCHEAQRAMMTPQEYAGYWAGTAVKYIWRWRGKNGIQDLKKAKRCLEFLIEHLEGGGDDVGSGTTDH
jgi:hypothetical protein